MTMNDIERRVGRLQFAVLCLGAIVIALGIMVIVALREAGRREESWNTQTLHSLVLAIYESEHPPPPDSSDRAAVDEYGAHYSAHRRTVEKVYQEQMASGNK
jgi:hypothetical protein